MTIRFEGDVATVTRGVREGRPKALLAAVAVAAAGIATMRLGPSWASWVGVIVLGFGILVAFMALLPDERIEFDGAAKEVRIARQYFWQAAERTTVLPFSAVASIGVHRTGDGDGGSDYDVTLHLNRGRNVQLWRVFPKGRTELETYLAATTEPDFVRLAALTGFRREHRFD